MNLKNLMKQCHINIPHYSIANSEEAMHSSGMVIKWKRDHEVIGLHILF